MRILIENIAHQPSTSPFFGGLGETVDSRGALLRGATRRDRKGPACAEVARHFCEALGIDIPRGQVPVGFTSALYTVVDDRGVSETGTLPCLGAALHQQPTAF